MKHETEPTRETLVTRLVWLWLLVETDRIYRRLRGLDRRHWLESAIRRTWVPAAAVALSFAIAGGAMHWYAPEATSIGEVWQHLAASPR